MNDQESTTERESQEAAAAADVATQRVDSLAPQRWAYAEGAFTVAVRNDAEGRPRAIIICAKGYEPLLDGGLSGLEQVPLVEGPNRAQLLSGPVAVSVAWSTEGAEQTAAAAALAPVHVGERPPEPASAGGTGGEAGTTVLIGESATREGALTPAPEALTAGSAHTPPLAGGPSTARSLLRLALELSQLAGLTPKEVAKAMLSSAAMREFSKRTSGRAVISILARVGGAKFGAQWARERTWLETAYMRSGGA